MEFKKISNKELQTRLRSNQDFKIVDTMDKGKSFSRSKNDYESFEDALNKDEDRFFKDVDLSNINTKKDFYDEIQRVADSSAFDFKQGNQARKAFLSNKDKLLSRVAFVVPIFRKPSKDVLVTKPKKIKNIRYRDPQTGRFTIRGSRRVVL